MNYRFVSFSVSICILLMFLISYANPNARDGNSRLLKHRESYSVDLMQYCGKTVEELLDDLGDYVEYRFISPHLVNVIQHRSCKFRYDKYDLEIVPKDVKYCDTVGENIFWNLEDFKKEDIGYLELSLYDSVLYSWTERKRKTGEDLLKGKRRTLLDYEKYFGLTPSDLLDDYTPIVESITFTQSVSVSGSEWGYFVLAFKNQDVSAYVTLYVYNSSDISDISGERKEYLKNNFLENSKIMHIEIKIRCKNS